MTRQYYHSFATAPLHVVTAIAVAAEFPCITGAYVGTDNSLFLDVYEPGVPRMDQLEAIAEMCEVPMEFLFVEPGIDEDHLSITLLTTCFDFSDRFKGHPLERYCTKPLPGEDDSEECIEAQLALSAARG